MKKFLKPFSFLTIAILLFSLTGCSSNTTVADIQKKGTLVVGTSADYPPYEFTKPVNGKNTYVGFDIEIVKQIAKDMRVKLEIKDMNFDGLLPALDTNNVDIVVAGMTPTEKRKKSVDFSEIYYNAIQSLVVRKSDVNKYTSIDDLKGKTIGVQKGAIQEQIAKQQLPNSTPQGLFKISDLALSLKTQKIDAFIVERPVADAYVKNNPDLTVSSISFKQSDSGSAIAVKKGNKDLIDFLNKSLDKLKNSGTIDKLVLEATQKINE